MLGTTRKRHRTESCIDEEGDTQEVEDDESAPPDSPYSPSLDGRATLRRVKYHRDDDLQKLSSVDEAVLMIKDLRDQIDATGYKNSKGLVLSTAVFSVESPKTVTKMRLGRASSVSTMNELQRLNSLTPGTMPAQLDFYEVMNTILKPGQLEMNQAYLQSCRFADDILNICGKSCSLFRQEKRLLSLSSPMYVFGDLHGNMEDLQFFGEHIWPMNMRLTAGTFLFLGDYVDRGVHGLELIAYLLCQKLQLPDKVFLIRGNHETRAVNGWESYYGSGSFIHQCKSRFGDEKGLQVWESLNQVFDYMPLAAIVDDSIFCVHGGIPCPTHKMDDRLNDISKIPCPIDIRPPNPSVPDEMNRLAFSLLWADPADSGQEEGLDLSSTGFGESARGGGTVVFGNKAVLEFLGRFKLDYILRAHEATANGVTVCKSAKVLTIFSTSKDHGCGGNAKCGCVLIDRNRIQAITRSASYHGVVDAPAFSAI